jgi:hypothetical protein
LFRDFANHRNFAQLVRSKAWECSLDVRGWRVYSLSFAGHNGTHSRHPVSTAARPGVTPLRSVHLPWPTYVASCLYPGQAKKSLGDPELLTAMGATRNNLREVELRQ